MSVGRQVNWKGQMRVDVPHMRAMESSIVYDFDTLAGMALSGGNPFVLKGFYLSAWVVGADPETLSLVVADGLIFNHNASENGTMLQVPSDRSAEVLASVNNRVEGSWTSGTNNYVAIDFVRTEDTTTNDVVQFLDPTSLNSAPKIIPLGRTLDYRIVVSTEPFASNKHLCPVAIVTLDGNGNVSAIVDARTMYFRLASGGDSPNPLGVYPWPQGRAEAAGTFVGGDKAITNEKDWKSAVMQRLWEITGGEYWYSDVTDRNLKFYADYADQHARLGVTSNVIWSGGLVSWKGLHVLLNNSTGSVNNVTDNVVGVGMNDGDVAYVELNRYVDGSALAVTVVTTAAYKALPAPTRVGSRYILFWRKGADVYSRLDWLAVGRSSSAATTGAYGLVKTNSVNQPAGGPFVIISDSGVNGNAVAAGLTRGGAGDGLGAGNIVIGGGVNDNQVDILSQLIVQIAAGNVNAGGFIGHGTGAGISATGGATGVGAVLTGNANRAPLLLTPQTAPLTPSDGELWYNTTTKQLQVQANAKAHSMQVQGCGFWTVDGAAAGVAFASDPAARLLSSVLTGSGFNLSWSYNGPFITLGATNYRLKVLRSGRYRIHMGISFVSIANPGAVEIGANVYFAGGAIAFSILSNKSYHVAGQPFFLEYTQAVALSANQEIDLIVAYNAGGNAVFGHTGGAGWRAAELSLEFLGEDLTTIGGAVA